MDGVVENPKLLAHAVRMLINNSSCLRDTLSSQMCGSLRSCIWKFRNGKFLPLMSSTVHGAFKSMCNLNGHINVLFDYLLFGFQHGRRSSPLLLSATAAS
jgi:hypothetical protein